jgi:hypothetical protein
MIFKMILLKDFNDYRFNVILKARQLGISTITAGYITWMMLFHRDKAILVMATKFATAGNLVKKVKSIMRNLPDWIKIATILLTTEPLLSFQMALLLKPLLHLVMPAVLRRCLSWCLTRPPTLKG